MPTRTKPTPETPQSLLVALKAKCETWQWTAIRLEELTGKRFDRALLNRVARGKQAAPNSLRLALGFPVMVPVVACSACGEPHIRKTCPKSHKSGPTRRRPTWRDVRAAFVAGALAAVTR